MAAKSTKGSPPSIRLELEEALAKAHNSAEYTGHILDTITFVAEAAKQDCSDTTAMDYWLVVIDALADKAKSVLKDKGTVEIRENGGAQ